MADKGEEMNSEIQWYFVVDGEEGRRREGPVSKEDLAAMLSAGEHRRVGTAKQAEETA